MEVLNTIIAKELAVKPEQVAATIALLDDGNTVPFIARYRKEVTGELKDEQIRTIEERCKYLRNVEERRAEIVASITEQGKMTDELAAKLAASYKLQELEDLYLPYRPKKRTRASIAREQGLEPLAALMLKTRGSDIDPVKAASEYLSDDVETAEAALQGAMDIIAEDTSDRADVRSHLRNRCMQEGRMVTSFVGDEKEQQVYLTYAEFSQPVRQLQAYQILAINRGEKEKALKVQLEVAEDRFIAYIQGKLQRQPSSFTPYIEATAKDCFKRLLFPALERDIRRELTEKADEQSIAVFATNLKNLLLIPPLAGHVIMGLDPGYRTGCKMAIIDQQGNVLAHGTYYLTHSDKMKAQARRDLTALIKKCGVTLLSIGNGTASYETEQFVSSMIEEEGLSCRYLITNEAGASVYSASKLAIEELPDLDVSHRGAVSIARRVQDPLAEAVKIDPKSIGVGQYQHDVNQKRLGEMLDQVVETVVNHVGVELNTASPAILQHVAGISATVAKNITAYRLEHGAFGSRKELLKVPRLGPAAFTQCAGFLRIREASYPLDRTSVHPESYELAERIVESLGFSLTDWNDKGERAAIQAALEKAVPQKLAQALDAGEPTVRDIVEALLRPGRDPREDLPAPMTRQKVMDIKDIACGTVLKGMVQNVVEFGAFVDIGIKVNGLLHRMEFCKRNQRTSEVLAVGDIITVEVAKVEPERNRIGLKLHKS